MAIFVIRLITEPEMNQKVLKIGATIIMDFYMVLGSKLRRNKQKYEACRLQQILTSWDLLAGFQGWGNKLHDPDFGYYSSHKGINEQKIIKNTTYHNRMPTNG